MLTALCADLIINTAAQSAGWYRDDQPRGHARNGVPGKVTQAPFGFLLWQLILLLAGGVACGRVSEDMGAAITAGGLVYGDANPASSLFTMPSAGGGGGGGGGGGAEASEAARGAGRQRMSRSERRARTRAREQGGDDVEEEEDEAEEAQASSRTKVPKRAGFPKWSALREGGLATDSTVFRRQDFGACCFCGEPACHVGRRCITGLPKAELQAPQKKFYPQGMTRAQLARLYARMTAAEARA
jgi:hypothetical protein